MEDLLTLVIGVLTGFVGFYVGQRIAPKNKQLSETIRFYEDTMTGLRTELKRWKGKAGYYMKGAIPSELATTSTTAGLVEGVFNSLPPNLRGLAEPFKATAIKYAEENPEVVENLKNSIMQKLGQAKEQENAPIDSL